MASLGKHKEILKKEDVIQALVIADSFEVPFRSLTDDFPTVLLPLVNIPILQYTLEFLQAAGVQEVILFCCAHSDKIKEFIRNSRWETQKMKMRIRITISENCMSLGDVLRDVYDKRLITDDFILLTGDVVSNAKLQPILEIHKERRKKEKHAVMTSVYKKASLNHETLSADGSTLILFNEETNRILHSKPLDKKKKMAIPLNLLIENANVKVCCDFLDCHISICSPEVLSLFADNYDYQTKHDFLKGILEQEEILGNTIYMYLIDDEYAARVSNLHMYKALSHDIINRWTFPFVPDLFLGDSKEAYIHLRHNIYKHQDVTLARSCKLVKDVVVGSGTKIGASTVITQSVIGHNCIIGNNVTLKNAYVWNNVEILDNCKIEMAILSHGVVCNKNAVIFNSVLPTKFQVKIDSEVKNTFVLSEEEEEPKDDSSEEGEQDPWQVTRISDVYESSDDESDEDVPHMDDANAFYLEVLDTLLRGIEEKLKCDNLILEINSLKYAYNMTISEVNHVVTKSIMEIPGRLSKQDLQSKDYLIQLKQILGKLMGLIKNYIKNSDSQLDLLSALKEYAVGRTNFSSILMNLLHYLYDAEVLQEESILLWHNELMANDSAEKLIKEQVKPFINWLNDAEEESD